MNRKEALLHLLEGQKIVSYFGYEFELTKHGLNMLAPEGESSAFVPFPFGNEYTLLGKPGNPYHLGSMEWAEWEFEHGREVTSPSGQYYAQYYSGQWDNILISPRDLREARWSVLRANEEESLPVVPPPSALTPSESEDNDLIF